MASVSNQDLAHPAMIPFTRALTAGSELDYLSEAIARKFAARAACPLMYRCAGNGGFTA
jgi:hypothetical protein